MPKWNFLKNFRRSNAAFKDQQRHNYDCHHGVWPLPAIPYDWITSGDHLVTGRVISPPDTPRSNTQWTSKGKPTTPEHCITKSGSPRCGWTSCLTANPNTIMHWNNYSTSGQTLGDVDCSGPLMYSCVFMFDVLTRLFTKTTTLILHCLYLCPTTVYM